MKIKMGHGDHEHTIRVTANGTVKVDGVRLGAVRRDSIGYTATVDGKRGFGSSIERAVRAASEVAIKYMD